jgi:hypothetical protein
MNLAEIKAHYDRYLGESDDAEPMPGIRILDYQPDTVAFVTFASLGLSASGVTAVYPQEVICSVRGGQDGAADYLVRSVVELVMQSGRGVINEDVIPNDGPLLEDTQIYGILVASHPYLPDEFNVVFGPGRAVVTDLMTLIPITDKEIALAQNDGIDALITRLEESGVDLFDVTRDSAG